MIARTLRSECPVMVAISASVHPAIANRVTAVPRKSWNVTPITAARLHALPHDARNPSGVHGFPSAVVSIIGERFGAASSAALSGAPTGITTRVPPFRLPQANVRSVIRRPGQTQEVALPLAGPQREQERQVQMRWCAFQKCNFVGIGPNLLRA